MDRTTGGPAPEAFLYLLELTDSHQLIRKPANDYRVVPRIPTLGYVPRAENFDFIYPDVRSNDYGFKARDQQLALKDGSFYEAYAAMNRTASVAFSALKGDPLPGTQGPARPTAIFYFFGHGGGPFVDGASTYLLCWDGNQKSYIVDKAGMRDDLVALGVPAAQIQVIDSPGVNLDHVLLAVLEGCYTAHRYLTGDRGTRPTGW